MPITRSLPLCRRTFVTDLAFNLIMDCGQAMLANGGEVFRAQDTMEIMARSFGIVDFHVYVLTNGIFASAQNGTGKAGRRNLKRPRQTWRTLAGFSLKIRKTSKNRPVSIGSMTDKHPFETQ